MKKRILLEGPDDQAVIGNLLFNYKLDNEFELKKKDGIDKLYDTLPDELEATDISCLGVVIDADFEVQSRWARLTNALRLAGYSNVPPSPVPGGAIVTESGLVPVGLWLMPDNQSHGAIEDFVGSFVEPHDKLWPKAHKDVDDIPEDHRKFSMSHRVKAVVHTWLAWQEEPGSRLGQVFRKQYVNSQHPNATQFVAWLQTLKSTSEK
jgi:hypothetical protein